MSTCMGGLGIDPNHFTEWWRCGLCDRLFVRGWKWGTEADDPQTVAADVRAEASDEVITFDQDGVDVELASPATGVFLTDVID